MRQDKNTDYTRARILTAIGAIAIVLVALFLFIWANTVRITEQNYDYLINSTEQSARRINDLLGRSLDIVETASAIYENNVAPEDMGDPTTIAEKLRIDSFDYTFFVSPDGIGYRDEDGNRADVSDKPYYDDGMQGNSGIVALSHGAFSEHDVLVFYSPLKYGDTVYGVICGAYREETISDYYMKTEYFGHATPTYLCDSSGLIVARSVSCESAPTTIQQLLANSDTSITEQEISKDLKEGKSATFTYQSDGHGGDTYLTKLEDFNWMLMRSFPEAITDKMIERASISGTILVAGVIIAAAIAIIVLTVQSRRRQEVLLLERQNATRIIDASTELFHSMLEIDLTDGTYRFLKSDKSLDIPPTGNFDTFFEALTKTSTEEYKEVITEKVSLSAMTMNLKNEDYYQLEYHMTDGEINRWIQVSVLKLVSNDEGEPLKVLIAAQDTTDIKEKELRQRYALEEAYRAAEYASKAKSDFLNNMSHDIRTPMNSIMGMISIAGMHMDDPRRVSECLSNISAASQHLLGLINEVLDMAKIESGNIALAEESFELPEMIDSLMTIIHPQIEAKNQKLCIELDNLKHENVIGDSTRLQQVFVNIMGNAVKFTDEGGEITLRIKELPSRIYGNATYQFQFKDTGCGMTPEFAATVFEPFARANDTRTTKTEGTGLGMAIVKSVVELMNGSVDVESEVGVGSVFTVVVNLKIDEQEDEEIELSGKILVVDDEIEACETTCEILEELGMEAEYVLDGQSAVTKVIESEASDEDTPYDAVILDWKMPGMSGIETAKEIRLNENKRIPIILFSGYDWSTIESEARDAGVDAFLMKSLLFRSRLLRLLQELIEGKSSNVLDQSSLLKSLAFQGRRILLTEDNAMAACIAQEIIEMTGAEVFHAENGKIAYEELLSKEPGHYDMVFMDIQMPVMNGYETTKAIRKAGQGERPDLAELPIVALSADAFADDIKKARVAGMNEHMSKPLEIEPLVKILAKWIPIEGKK